MAPVLPATPADRSISPSRSTGTRPSASTQIGPAWVTRLAMLSLVVKVSLAKLKMTTSSDQAEDGRAASPCRRRGRG